MTTRTEYVMKQHVVVRLDDPKYPAGPATVIDGPGDRLELKTKHLDRDGCLADNLRVWLDDGNGAIGRRVQLADL